MRKVFKFLLCLVFIVPAGLTTHASNRNTSSQACPVPYNAPELAQATTIFVYSDAILNYLSNGGDPTELETTLIQRRIVQAHTVEGRSPLNPPFANRGGVRSADFNGDGFIDVAVSIFDPTGGYSGALFVYICNGQRFRQITSPLLYAINPYTHEPEYVDRAPKFIYAGDMNNDGRAELVYDIGVSGASTVFEDVQIAGWNDATQDMRPLNADQDSYPANAGYYKVVNAANGYKMLVLRTGFSGSGPATGPQRQFTLTYGWNGHQFVEVSAVGDPSSDRLHVVYDALAALNHGALKTAVILYNQVLKNNRLEDWYDGTRYRNFLNSLAGYGLLLARTKQFGVNSTFALQAYHQLKLLAEPLNEADSLWIKYGDIFWQTAHSTHNLHAACQKVNDTIQADVDALPAPEPKTIRWLGIWPWFTYNVNWIPTDRGLSFCPF